MGFFYSVKDEYPFLTVSEVLICLGSFLKELVKKPKISATKESSLVNAKKGNISESLYLAKKDTVLV
ncbi:hypothetical protein D1835_10000 [Enterococcus asini]|nr:hypothetical protein [Enterococcus asini]